MYTPAQRWSITTGLALALFGACGAGCSNLSVKKVPISDRVAHEDHQKGFRYYLNRPYLTVKKPILIAETISLVKADPKQAAPSLLPMLPMPGASKQVRADVADPTL